MSKGPDAFRTISEVAEELNIPQHVLRFWETRFTQIKPIKRGGGRRFYRPDDVSLLAGIRHLLYGAGYTIRGVQRILKEQGVAHVQGLVLAPADTSSASVHAVASALDNIRPQYIAAPSYDIDSKQALDNRLLELKLDDTGVEASSIPDALLPRDFKDDRNVNKPSHSPSSQGYQPPPSPPLGSSVDARVATVAAAYAALTPASAPLHPRDGFAIHHDAAADIQQHDPTANATAEISSALTDVHVASGISHYAPGPLSAGSASGRTHRLVEQSGTAQSDATDHIIQPQYRLTTGTRENLQSVLEELRECRRLLGSTLNRQID